MEIFVENLNETFLRIESENEAIYDDLVDKFSFEVPGHRFMPAFKDGSWNGRIELFNRRDKTIYKGIGKEVIDFLKSDDYGEIKYKGFIKKPDLSEVFDTVYERILSELPDDLVPYDFQMETVREAFCERRRLVISPTSSGKSLMIYLYVMCVKEVLQDDEKFLLIVPTITLVDQMFDDFRSYGYDGSAHLITGGVKKDSDEWLYISTWQSLLKENIRYFKKFAGVIVDEVHGAAAKSLKGSVEKCVNAEFRAGFTGTLSGFDTDELVLKGLFGPKVVATTYQEMRDLGIIPDVDIEMVRARYSERYKDVAKSIKGDFQQETEFVTKCEARDEILVQIMREFDDKNGIFLFKTINHLQRIEKLFKKLTNRPVVVINGGVAKDIRAEIRRSIDKNANEGIRDVLLLATYGTMSTGVSIKNLDYGVFAAPMKSKIKVLQSLGRLLRKSTSKTYARLIDIWDDLSTWTKSDNYGKSHAKSRLQFYTEAGFRIVERVHVVD